MPPGRFDVTETACDTRPSNPGGRGRKFVAPSAPARISMPTHGTCDPISARQKGTGLTPTNPRPAPQSAILRLSAGAALLLTLAAPVAAADKDGRFAVDGIGARACSDYTKAVDDKNRDLLIAFASWTSGFVSAANVYGTETFDLTPWQTPELIQAKLDKFCRAFSQEPYVQALGKLISTLQPQRMTASEGGIPARVGGQSILVYPEVLRRIRAEMGKEGIKVTTPEDAFDDAFADGLRAYQKAKGIPPSGLPDLPTMNMMFP